MDEGEISFDQEDITHVPMEQRGFNIVFQDYALFPNLNVYKNMPYGLRNNPGIATAKDVDDLIKLLGLEAPPEQKGGAAFRRTEAAGGPGPDDGDEAEDPSAG